MANNDFWELEIPKWETHNPTKKILWHKVDSTIIGRGEFLSISATSRLLWFVLLCQRATAGSSCFHVSSKNVCNLVSIKPNRLPKVIQELCDLDWLRVVKAPSRARYERTDGRTDGRTEAVASATMPAPPKISEEKKQPSQPKLPTLAELWNEHCGSLAKVKSCSDQRKAKCGARIKEHTAEEWVQVIKRIAASDFCNGRVGNGDRRWVADFDFLIKPDTFERASEGRYDNREQNKPTDVHRAWADAF